MTLPRSGSPSPPNGQKRLAGRVGSLRAVPRRLLLLLLVGIPAPGARRRCSRGAFCAHRRCPSSCRPRSRRSSPISRCRPSTDVSAVADRGRRRLRPVHGGRLERRRRRVHRPRRARRRARPVARLPALRRARRLDERDGDERRRRLGRPRPRPLARAPRRVVLADAPGSSAVLRSYDKVGFCFFDQRPLVTQPSTAPTHPQFPKSACNGHGTLEFTMGLSPGWGDPYPWALPGPAAPADGSRRRRLPPLGDGRPWSLVPRGQRDEQRHVARSPRAASDDSAARRGRPPRGPPGAPMWRAR